MINYKKYVFTSSIKETDWPNTTLVDGNLSEEVNKIKKLGGKDIIVYGGASFVSSLVQHNLIDEYYLFLNPSAIGKGLRIFDKISQKFELKLIESVASGCGIVINKFVPISH